MHNGKAVPLDGFVQQRAGNDCEIAATATVTGISYEKIADAFSIPLDPKGQPDTVILGNGINPFDPIFPLFGLGWFAAPLAASENKEFAGIDRRPGFPTSDQIKTMINGRKAVLGYQDADDKVGRHALAWDGNQAIDCTDGEIVDLIDVTILTALVLTPA